MVNTNQQVGGSIGTALLNTIAASAFSSYLLTHGPSPAAQAGAAVHSYIVAFWVSAGDFRRRRDRVRARAALRPPGAGRARGRPGYGMTREEMSARDFRSR